MSLQTTEYRDAWRAANKDKIKEYNRRDYLKRREAIKTQRATPAARKKLSDYLRAWRAEHVDSRRAAMREWMALNKERMAAYRKAYAERRRLLYDQQKEKICCRKRELSKTQKYRERVSRYSQTRRRNDILFSLKGSLRATMNRAFRRQWIKKPLRTETLLGCTISEAKAHIESHFVGKMSWANRTTFHIDHCVPVAAFDLRDTEEQQLAFNWRNLQPLPPHDNHSKLDKLPNPLPSWLPPHIAARILARKQNPPGSGSSTGPGETPQL